MKKELEKAEVEVIKFEKNADVVTASVGEGPTITGPVFIEEEEENE